jgi:HD superfamily phosphohydrolase
LKPIASATSGLDSDVADIFVKSVLQGVNSPMKSERIRDPIHDLIVFDESGLIDAFAWELLKTPDMQRLRRIKQLGVSELVFPSASHTRFAHSVGVFHNARRLVQLIRRELSLERVAGSFLEERAKVALFASLLHDIGHGPFSHAFEEARKALAAERAGDTAPKAKIRKHEQFTADMIEDQSGQIGEILARAGVKAKDVADLIGAETPTDMYHAVVSSSLDADRLDYLVRDRYMTGTGAGAIDLEWLMDNVRVAEIDFSPPDADGGDPVYEHSFCLGYKARDAAEDFLLARYRLYTNVYFHKTTRGIEQLVSAFFRFTAREVTAKSQVTGLRDDHPLVRFFSPGGEDLANYRAMDDTVIWGAIHAVAVAGAGPAKEIADRILNRKKPTCLDIQHTFPEDPEKQRRLKHKIDQMFQPQLGESVFRDVAKLSIYGEIGGDDSRAQKRLMIQMADTNLKEITDFKDATVAGSDRQRMFERYYFLNEGDYKKAQDAVDSVRRRQT